ncbi:AAA-like domain-containing protein [Acaryochloris sp. CCMEE 5410]|uniref:WD40 domain-containing protein n=1 Tax=Acaryochloris sp. CCMEE 5410 TaxID=310037 RepID=UPI0021D0CB5D|nr:AAA-like domain-containing protein [Acaryochloris sp. CCMEE 5410]
MYEKLSAGQFCYVLNARQSGKSSLRVRTMSRLQEVGFACVAIDLTLIGSQLNFEQWYVSLIDIIALELDLDLDVVDWWEAQHILSPLNRFQRFIETEMLKAVQQPTVIFIDEIDYVLSLPFPTDDFFAFVRACYNQRADNPIYQHLTFCFLGVASPNDLIADKQRTPFNIGQSITLKGFQIHEAGPLVAGLKGKVNDPEEVVADVLYWTGGQPFLTQKLCHLVLEREERKPVVANLVQTSILENWEAQDEPVHLRTIRDRMLHDERIAGQLLGLYQQILQQRQISSDENSPGQLELRLTGLVVKEQELLKPLNPIYATIFDQEWIDQAAAELRPAFYAEAFREWRDADIDKSDAFLLRGQALREAEAWAKSRYISDLDRNFLDASQALERQDTERRLQVEQEEKAILTTARKRATKQLFTTTVVSVVVVLGTVVLAWNQGKRANRAGIRAKQFEQEVQEAQDKIEIKDQRLIRINKDLTKRKNQIKIARNKLGESQRRVTAARQKERQALQKFHRARQRVGQVEERFRQVSQSKHELEQEKYQAQYYLEAAQIQLLRTQSERRKAEVDLEDAQLRTRIALQGSELERQNTAVLRQFRLDESGALLNALLMGQELQFLVQQKTASYDVQLVNHKLTLEQYPALRPIGTLLEILFNIRERLFDPHQGKVMSMSWSSDGQILATGGEDGSVKLWTRVGEPIKLIEAHEGKVLSISWSSDGQILATGGEDGSVKLWTRSGIAIRTIKAFQHHVVCMDWSNDNQILATCGSDGMSVDAFDTAIKLWTRSGTLIRKIKAKQGTIESISWSRDGKILATGGYQGIISPFDGTMNLWTRSGEMITSITKPGEGRIMSVSWSRNGQILALASSGSEGMVELRNRKGELITSLRAHPIGVFNVSWIGDGQTLVTSGRDGTVKRWNRALKPTTIFEDKKSIFKIVSWSNDGKTLALFTKKSSKNSSKEFLRLLMPRKELVTSVGPSEGNKGPGRSILSMSWSRDSKTLATTGDSGSVDLWTEDGKWLNAFQVKSGGSILRVSLSKDGQILATSGFDGNLKLWTRDGKQIISAKAHKGRILDIRWSNNGQTLASSGDDGIVHLWTRSGEKIISWQTDQGQVNSICWDSDGQILATGGDDGTIKLWTKHGKLIASIQSRQSSVLSMEWRQDGQVLATGGDDGKVNLWTRALDPVATIVAHQGGIRFVSWRSDGEIFATVGTGENFKLWTQDGRQISEIKSNIGDITGISWINGGKTLITGTALGYMEMFSFEDLETLLARGCDWLNSYLITTPRELQKLKVCQTPTRRLEAAPFLVDYSESLAKDGRIEEAIQGFQDAQTWDPRLNFDTKARAKKLAKEAKQQK